MTDLDKEWDSNKSSPQSKHYFSVNTELRLENYLMKLPESQRTLILKLRASLLRLSVTSERYDNIPYEQRVCTSCKSGHIGDEFHFILECQTLSCRLWHGSRVVILKIEKSQ